MSTNAQKGCGRGKNKYVKEIHFLHTVSIPTTPMNLRNHLKVLEEFSQFGGISSKMQILGYWPPDVSLPESPLYSHTNQKFEN